MGGKPLPRPPLFNALISPHEALISARRRHCYANFHTIRDTTSITDEGVSRDWGDDDKAVPGGTIGRVNCRLGERGCDGCCG
jgi:hypothetical protein